jgi:hypothetical protein
MKSEMGRSSDCVISVSAEMVRRGKNVAGVYEGLGTIKTPRFPINEWNHLRGKATLTHSVTHTSH